MAESGIGILLEAPYLEHRLLLAYLRYLIITLNPGEHENDMEPIKETLNDQIERLADNEDADGLIQLMQQLEDADLQKYKTELSEACEGVFYIWLNDLQLGKIKTKEQESVITMLSDLLQAAEIVTPDESLHIMRALLYEHLSDLKTDPGEKLAYIDKAIEEYTTGLEQHTSAEMSARLVEALLNKMQQTEDFNEKALTDILLLFQTAFTTYSEQILIYFLHSSFRLLSCSFSDNTHWHHRFLTQLEHSLKDFGTTDPYIYLEYTNALRRVLDNQLYNVSATYHAALNAKAITLLEPLKDYQTKHEQRLNYLGQAFEKVAERVEDHTAKIQYYHTALAFFTEGQLINPADWTFPVYATNVLMEIARLDDPNKAIALFEQGKALFARTYVHGTNFTLMHYWGKFLIEYARQVYNFNAPEILKEAEEKLLLAKQLGNGYYAQPYRGLAKVALKLGNRQQCLNILAECKKAFTTDYYEYEHSVVLADEDFREIWPELQP